MSESDGFDGYEQTSVDPGIWLLLFTTLFCFFVMLVGVPLMVAWKRQWRAQSAPSMIHEALHKTAKMSTSAGPVVDVTLMNILRVDKETKKIMGLATPFTVSALSTSICSNGCLILVSRFVGTKAAAAYAIVQVLVGLSDGVLRGPVSACTSLCAHAVGAGNSDLAGEYIQLAITFYMLFNIPVIIGWYIYMYDVVLYLEWGDIDTAKLASAFVRVYIFSYLFSAVSTSLWQLLEITNHAVVGTIFDIIWGFFNVLLIGATIGIKGGDSLTLVDVAWIYNGTSLFFIFFTYALADCRGWLKPFKRGLYQTFALRNVKGVKLMLKQAVPLSCGYLLSNAEWAVLTFMASYLGPAEVAAWAILGSIWDVFYTTTAGIGDAAEIRVSHHLGENSPTMAQLSAYKSLFLGMSVASVVSLIYFSLQDQIPAWFTKDETLQGMLRELVPFVGVANLTMTFGMQCWSCIGSQGKYSMATWVSFVSSWGICMPLAAIFTYGFRFDLQGLTAAATIGYVSTGATLSYILLGTDWYKVAYKIQERNNETSNGQSNGDEEELDGLYASIMPARRGAKAAARRNIRLLVLPAGARSGITIGSLDNKPGKYVLRVRCWSLLRGSIHVGNALLAINGKDATRMNFDEVSNLLKNREIDRVLAVVVPDGYDDEVDEADDDQNDRTDDSDVDDEKPSSPVFWNDGFFGYLTPGSQVKQTSTDDDKDPGPITTNYTGVLETLAKVSMARKQEQKIELV